MIQNSFVLYTSYLKHIELLSIEQRGMLLTAIFEYASGDEPSDLDDMTRMAFSFIRSDMDENAEKYQKTINARREAGKKGGRPKISESDGKQKKQMLSVETNRNQKNPVYENEYVDVNEKDKKNNRRFTPPTLEEVQSFINEHGYRVDANRFIDFYSSKGWMIGKNKMKDWQAAVRGWASRDKQQQGSKFNNFQETGTNWDDVAYQIMANQ